MSKYFSYGPGHGFEYHNSAKEAKEAAQAMIDDCRESAGAEGWDVELVEGVCWGGLSEAAQVSGNCTSGFDYDLMEVAR